MSSTDDLRKESLLRDWKQWKKHQPVHRKKLVDEFHRWLVERGRRLIPSYEEIQTWIHGFEGWIK